MLKLCHGTTIHAKDIVRGDGPRGSLKTGALIVESEIKEEYELPRVTELYNGKTKSYSQEDIKYELGRLQELLTDQSKA